MDFLMGLFVGIVGGFLVACYFVAKGDLYKTPRQPN